MKRTAQVAAKAASQLLTSGTQQTGVQRPLSCAPIEGEARSRSTLSAWHRAIHAHPSTTQRCICRPVGVVLLWINGPFGVGKTHVAAEIHHRLSGTWVADPELVGFGLHRMLPPAARGDFQDMSSWRVGVVEALHTALRSNQGLVIAPQTIVNEQYFEEIMGGLRDRAHEVKHVALLARPKTVIERLKHRGFGKIPSKLGVNTLARESFAVDRVESYLERLQQPLFSEHIWTDNLSVSDVAEAAAAACGLQLEPAEKGAVRTAIRRAKTTLQNMRSD